MWMEKLAGLLGILPAALAGAGLAMLYGKITGHLFTSDDLIGMLLLTTIAGGSATFVRRRVRRAGRY